MSKTIGEHLKEARGSLGMSVADLALASGVSPRMIRQFEADDFTAGKKSAVALSAALGGLLSPAFLAGLASPTGDVKSHAASAALKMQKAKELAQKAAAIRKRADALSDEAMSELHMIPDALSA
jgi:transcriptional regulator with XRE-family HTH domain